MRLSRWTQQTAAKPMSHRIKHTADNLLSLGSDLNSGLLAQNAEAILSAHPDLLESFGVSVVLNEAGESGKSKHVIFTSRPAFVSAFICRFVDSIKPMGRTFCNKSTLETIESFKHFCNSKDSKILEEKAMADAISITLEKVNKWKPVSEFNPKPELEQPTDTEFNFDSMHKAFREVWESSSRDLERLNREIAKESQSQQAQIIEGIIGEVLEGEWIPLPLPGVVISQHQITRIALKLSRRGLGSTKAIVILSAILQAQKRAA